MLFSFLTSRLPAVRSASSALLLIVSSGVLSSTPLAPEEEWQEQIRPLLEQHCYDCHGDGMKEGGLNFDHFTTLHSLHAERGLWLAIQKHVQQQLMPPLDAEPLPPASQKKLLEWMDRAIFPTDPHNPDPGPSTIRRLNRVEYENTVNDLLYTNLNLKKLLPADDTGYGYDTIGEVLTLSPAHLNRYLKTAEIALQKAVRTAPMPYPVRPVLFIRQEGDVGLSSEREYFFYKASQMQSDLRVKPGRYEVVIEASGSRGNRIAPVMRLSLNGKEQREFSVKNARIHGEVAVYRHRITVPADQSTTLSLAFVNDFYDPSLDPALGRDRNLYVGKVTLVGPLDGPRLPLPRSHRQLVKKIAPGETKEAYFRRVLTSFLERAFRRPAQHEAVERYLHYALEQELTGSSISETLQSTYNAVLLSPSFLYHKTGLEPSSGRLARIDQFTLANRLSYFLWSTMPDEALMSEAREGTLHRNLSKQLGRLLRDPKADQFVENFFGQWLQLRDVMHQNHSTKVFPAFNGQLRADMQTETRLFMKELLRKNLPLTTLLSADYTFLNERLARHYGLTGVKGPNFRKVVLNNEARGGLLGQGAFHLLTSHPDRTSPVLRGKYILENLLDISPPPPPQNVDQLGRAANSTKKTLRQELEAHRKDPSCASCHQLMDPIGFALEEFDATGRQRSHDRNGIPVDSTGTLISGETFEGVDGLRSLLINDYDNELARSFAKNLLTYALGRGVTWYDKPAVDLVVASASQKGYTIHSFIEAVIQSIPFQNIRGESLGQ